MDSGLYQQTPLGAMDSTRLLRLLPGEGAEPLVAELYLTHMIEAPVYEALSYAWDDPSSVSSITCNGQEMHVTIKLCDALRRARLKHEARVLWADAICVDQRSKDERSAQVRIMGRIYEAAKAVLVDVGDFVEEGDPGLVKETISVLKDTVANVLPALDSDASDSTKDQLKQEMLHKLSSHDFGAWTRFWTSPYWERAWPVQEVGLASRAVILYGSEEIEWYDLMLASSCLSHKDYVRDVLTGSEVRSAWVSYNRSARAGFSTRSAGLSDQIAFLGCLSSARRARIAGDPRDMVYAFLGHPSAHAFIPNYKDDVATVYYDFAVSCMQKYQDYTVLTMGARSAEFGDSGEVPSWCPMWNDRGQHNFPLLCLNRSLFYKPTGDRTSKFKIAGRQLRVSGVIVSAIKVASKPIRGHHLEDSQDGSHKGLNPLTESFKSVLNESDNCAKVYTDLMPSFARALIATCLSENAYSDKTASTSGPRDAQQVSQWLKYLESGRKYAAWNRSFFISQSGHMGLGPARLQEGDFCCVIFGSKVPFVIRRVSDTAYQLIGDCYVEGWMEGELMKDVGNGVFEELEIALK